MLTVPSVREHYRRKFPLSGVEDNCTPLPGKKDIVVLQPA